MSRTLALDPRLVLSKASRENRDVAAEVRLTEVEERRFEEILRAHQERVFRVALSVLGAGKRAEAEDVTQEVFLRLYRALPGFRGESLLSTWLYRVAFHAAIDVRRQPRLRRSHVSFEEGTLPPAEPSWRPAARDPLETARLEHEIERLPDVERSIVRLHYWMGYTVAEIGGLLALPQGTVKSHLHRARRRLARMLGREPAGRRGREERS